ncbi:hypothetical protein LRR81_07585 [Metabacillus sp. GX 13764]|uniref:hypothetical protein n=1 Tax=Metabacillus kandeliae TaxID=2900151 RepID=UPI001E4383E8|nr:hypothetical protein [Metabacillus kandeliae]MCD7034091.1 hypothetical protein [Metabacillus kandeliae]
MNKFAGSDTVSISINRPAEKVYEYLYDLSHFPNWVSYCSSIREEESGWVMETPYCQSAISVAERNSYFILDHVTVPAPGVEIHDAMRVIPNGSSCEVFLTGFQMPGMDDEKFAEGVLTGKKDLETLKEILEGERVY